MVFTRENALSSGSEVNDLCAPEQHTSQMVEVASFFCVYYPSNSVTGFVMETGRIRKRS